nr:SpoVA/SpoVAEb family sporulation membrane protein [uncultured Sellimonas sp.]
MMKQPKNQEEKKKQEAYQNYVKQKTPVHNVYKNMFFAFITGGMICTVGQGIYNYAESTGLSKELCGGYTSLLLVLISVLLTGFGLYTKIAKWGGAGALVPITGFANSVAAPAIEYKKEGQVFGIGCKIFTIAGPVILYGIVTSWGLGGIYYILSLVNISW